MAKSQNDAVIDEIIPPAPKGGPTSVKLATLGDVRAEMSRMYNARLRGAASFAQLTKSIWALRQIGIVIEAAEKLGIGAASDTDERPIFAGLTVLAPPLSPKIVPPSNDTDQPQPQPQRIKR